MNRCWFIGIKALKINLNIVSIQLEKSNAQIKTKIAYISFKCLLLPQYLKSIFFQLFEK